MAIISFLGLGNMGLAMATRLAKNNHQLRVYNRTASRAESLQRMGAQVFETPKEACSGASVIISMVADDEASHAMWSGEDGALSARLAPRVMAIECSTLSYAWAVQLSAQCTAHGLLYIDAPVTGLPDTAESGNLTLLVGAKEEDLTAARPILSDLAANILRFGEVGAGTAYKQIINLMGAVQIASAAEGLALAERAGLDLSVVADAISTSQAASPQVVRNVRRMLAGDHQKDIVFRSELRLKDVDYALRLAQQLDSGAPFGTLAGKIYRDLCTTDRSQLNESSVIEVLRSQRA